MRSSLIDQQKMKPESVTENPIRSKLIMCQKFSKLQNLENSQELDKPSITDSNSLDRAESKRIG